MLPLLGVCPGLFFFFFYPLRVMRLRFVQCDVKMGVDEWRVWMGIADTNIPFALI